MTEPAPRRTPVTTLRRGIALRGGRAKRALQVVEDEADRRLGTGRRGDRALALADDEDAAVERRRLELRPRARVPGGRPLGGGEQRRGGLAEPLAGLPGRGDDGARAVEQ